ncbi:MAG: glycosyl hydrolase [Planctomycetaceae bacterium]|nr:glycosyl hydrolase [Planctomycetaceae bacterium]
MKPDTAPTLESLSLKIDRLFELAGPKILDLERSWDSAQGTPVFTVDGRYTTRGWTEWTQGFQFGCQILQFDATDDQQFLDIGRRNTLQRMAPHVSHVGVHDHGFNQISTYGNLRRLAMEGRIDAHQHEIDFHELALKVSGAVQAARWTTTLDDHGHRTRGFVHSFNGPHSLFSDTIRSMRALGLSWQLGHVLMGENDQPISLLQRLIQHAAATAKYNVYYGQGRDIYDTPAEAGRVVHESIFNTTDGRYRCPSTQQGYSAFSTWTRGLAWIVCGYAEQLEFFDTLSDAVLEPPGSKSTLMSMCHRAAAAAADWYITHSFTDGMVYWDSGAPRIPRDMDYSAAPSNPHNDHEPIDSSAAAIAAQGLLRLGNFLETKGEIANALRYHRAACVIADTLFTEPYLSTDPNHQGLILHSIYHRPNGWDHTPPGRQIPCGESSLWGDYHAMELALLLKRRIADDPYITFFDRENSAQTS